LYQYDFGAVAGSIFSANLRINAPTPPGAAIPEPGTLALAATGLLPLAGAVVRKRRCKA
jgi:hypothetical protein